MNHNALDNINNTFNTLNSRVTGTLDNANLYNPQIPQSCLTVRDIRILSDRSISKSMMPDEKLTNLTKILSTIKILSPGRVSFII